MTTFPVRPGHWAVVVGINQYVGFRSLHFARKDAEAVASRFAELGVGHVTTVIQDAPPGVDPKARLTPEEAAPEDNNVWRALRQAREACEAAVQDGALDWEETRLYVYVSGHGVATTPEDAALLTAEADPDEPHGVSLFELKEFLARSQEFREVVLIADCCRDELVGAPPLGPPWTSRPHKGRPPVRVLFWRATAFAEKAYEPNPADKTPPDGHGYFTDALLDALAALAQAPDAEIDAAGLAADISRRFRAAPENTRGQMPALTVDFGTPFLLFSKAAATPPGPPPPALPLVHRLTLRARDEVEITVRDAAGKLRGGSSGSLGLELPPGDYTVRWQTGGSTTEEAVHLDASTVLEHGDPVSAAPLLGTASRNETHDARVQALATTVPAPTLAVILRYGRDQGEGRPAPDLGRVSVELGPLLPAPGPAPDDDRFTARYADVPPGPARLTIRRPSGDLDIPLTLRADWATWVFFTPDHLGQPDPASLEIQLARPGRPPGGDPGQNRAAAWALRSLDTGVNTLRRDELLPLLFGKWEDPLLGLIGGHALLLDPEPDWALLGEVLTNTAGLLPDHPDVLGLHGAAVRRWATLGRDGLPPLPARPGPARHLPSLWRSWQGLLWLDQNGLDGIVDGSEAEEKAPGVRPVGSWLGCASEGASGFLGTGLGVKGFWSAGGEGAAARRVRAWSEAAGTTDVAAVAAGTGLPVKLVRTLLGTP